MTDRFLFRGPGDARKVPPNAATLAAFAELAACRHMGDFVALRGRCPTGPRLIILAGPKGPRTITVS